VILHEKISTLKDPIPADAFKLQHGGGYSLGGFRRFIADWHFRNMNWRKLPAKSEMICPFFHIGNPL